ncbi:hypothetical protein [Alteromonas sp. 009811495]|uniref:hypothetical protein n=1 Tax=Alteromonas sp. 009811495 TaxID=3002962 RepID=UPI00237E3184|nr:hypothetical protein [Alteromonas sp. 009811495]WDT85123.1 hypothetical protein OZ660_14420 [Alteromonas sp. 009811495]
MMMIEFAKFSIEQKLTDYFFLTIKSVLGKRCVYKLTELARLLFRSTPFEYKYPVLNDCVKWAANVQTAILTLVSRRRLKCCCHGLSSTLKSAWPVTLSEFQKITVLGMSVIFCVMRVSLEK